MLVVLFFLQNFNVGDETKRKKMLHSIVLPIAISDIEILSRGIYQQQGNHNHHQYYFFRNCLFDVHKNIKKKSSISILKFCIEKNDTILFHNKIGPDFDNYWEQ